MNILQYSFITKTVGVNLTNISLWENTLYGQWVFVEVALLSNTLGLK